MAGDDGSFEFGQKIAPSSRCGMCRRGGVANCPLHQPLPPEPKPAPNVEPKLLWAGDINTNQPPSAWE